MKEEAFKSDLRFIKRSADELTIEGDLTQANAVEFERHMRELSLCRASAIKLDLFALDIDDPVAVAVAVGSIRELLNRSEKVIIKGAPQILGHNLYRVGALADQDAIELVDMRLDEPS